MMAYLIIDAGGTFFKSAIFNEAGELATGSSFMLPSLSHGSREAILGAYRQTVLHGTSFVAQNMSQSLSGIAIATPGPFDFENGISLMRHKFENIYGVSLRAFLREIAEGDPDLPVLFVHDVHAALFGEIRQGNAQGYANSALVSLGTGLGFGIAQNDVLRTNELRGPLFSIYNFPFRDGILEDYTSAKGVLKLYSELSGVNVMKLQAVDIGRLAKEGNKEAIRTFHVIAEILAASLMQILKDNQINCLLFGGQVSRSFPYMETGLSRLLTEVPSLKKIALVKSIDHSALIGACRYFIEHSPAAANRAGHG